MKYLVTGGAGFIGSHAAEALLKRGDSVVVVDEINDYYNVNQKLSNLSLLQKVALESKGSFRFVQADVADMNVMKQLFEEESFDRICHLAARAGVRPSIKDPFVYLHSNITATTVLLELSVRYNISNFVYASSSSVYGGNKKVPFSESDSTDNPISPYAATKKTCELLASTYSHLYKLNTTGLRFFTVYGPRGRPDMAPFLFVQKVSQGTPIDQFGDGTSSRDYTYISDIIQGVLASLDNPHQCTVYNLGNSSTVTLKEFISIVEKTVGVNAIVNQKPEVPGDVKMTCADLERSRREIGYSPKVGIEEGMRLFVEWYKTSIESEREVSIESTSITFVDRMEGVLMEASPPPTPPRSE